MVSLDDYETDFKKMKLRGTTYVMGDIESLMYWKGEDFDLVYHLAL